MIGVCGVGFKLKVTFVGATVGVGLFCDFIRELLSSVSSAASVFELRGQVWVFLMQLSFEWNTGNC